AGGGSLRALFAVAGLVFVLQVAVSALWLRSHRYGPAEYLLRWLTTWQRPGSRAPRPGGRPAVAEAHGADSGGDHAHEQRVPVLRTLDGPPPIRRPDRLRRTAPERRTRRGRGRTRGRRRLLPCPPLRPAAGNAGAATGGDRCADPDDRDRDR